MLDFAVLNQQRKLLRQGAEDRIPQDDIGVIGIDHLLDCGRVIEGYALGARIEDDQSFGIGVGKKNQGMAACRLLDILARRPFVPEQRTFRGRRTCVREGADDPDNGEERNCRPKDLPRSSSARARE